MAKKALASARRKAASPKTAAKPRKSPLKVAPNAPLKPLKAKTRKSTPPATVKPKKRTAKPAAARLRNTVDGYVSTLNDWRKDCVAGLRTMIHKAAPLFSGTGNRMRHIKLSSLKDLGKKELQELVRLAAKLNEIKGTPTRRPKGKAKHK